MVTAIVERSVFDAADKRLIDMPEAFAQTPETDSIHDQNSRQLNAAQPFGSLAIKRAMYGQVEVPESKPQPTVGDVAAELAHAIRSTRMRGFPDLELDDAFTILDKGNMALMNSRKPTATMVSDETAASAATVRKLLTEAVTQSQQIKRTGEATKVLKLHRTLGLFEEAMTRFEISVL